MNPNSAIEAAIATINEAIATIMSRHSIGRREAEQFALQQFEFMNADPNEVISAKRIVDRYQASMSSDDSVSSAVRTKIAKLIFKGLRHQGPTKSMPYYELQSAFQSVTGESLSQNVTDLGAVIEQLQHLEYIRWVQPKNRLPQIFQGIDFDEWSVKMTRDKDGTGTVTYNINGANARINNHSNDFSTNVVGESPSIQDQLLALRESIKKMQLPGSEQQSALDVADAVEAQFATGMPKKSVVTALMNTLPKVADIATIAGTIVALIK